MALGSKEGRPWRVGIQHPRQSGPLATVELADGEAIGTSGDYQRYFELDGKRYPHLLDPRSGYPASHTQAVTVLIPSGPQAGTRSDATSKPIFIAGPEGWREMAQQQQLAWVLRIDQTGKVQITEALSKRIKFVDSKEPVEVQP
jgi:thiamine biosynthesis lipoprotein